MYNDQIETYMYKLAHATTKLATSLKKSAHTTMHVHVHHRDCAAQMHAKMFYSSNQFNILNTYKMEKFENNSYINYASVDCVSEYNNNLIIRKMYSRLIIK